ncbi:uncharacterized protein MELLADRAFT_63671 [Melampsora larici-populina 98AG31]|uniref:Uncharacterized protein n=1 Tax=Melampsora larici-populina (strain 98AG31 / pathotype 3-4-7) TaxID=747676 RepID=F4RNJ7_MELLP|nr:uncharacterized protein MELLADRAFT_63671 [Melampsora larici-populina 98AG31]EGG06084.1 hypothetical protein MELLADRAFT_63671 [Melampsora larici-populina 98AG31]
MANAESRAIRANRRANGNNTQSTSTGANNSSIDGEDLPPDGESDVGKDSDSTNNVVDNAPNNRDANNLLPGGAQANPAPDQVIHHDLTNKSDSDNPGPNNSEPEQPIVDDA